MDKKTLFAGHGQEAKKSENWLKWFIVTIPALIAVIIIAYALQWVLWKWIWLAIPVWVVCYLLYKEYGTNYNLSGIHKINKYIDRDQFKEWLNKNKK